jgi:hypothetical protein
VKRGGDDPYRPIRLSQPSDGAAAADRVTAASTPAGSALSRTGHLRQDGTAAPPTVDTSLARRATGRAPPRQGDTSAGRAYTIARLPGGDPPRRTGPDPGASRARAGPSGRRVRCREGRGRPAVVVGRGRRGSRFITLSRALTKARPNFSGASVHAYISLMARNWELQAEHPVHGGGRPAPRAGGAVVALVEVLGGGGWLPLGADVEQVDEEVVGQRLAPVGMRPPARWSACGRRPRSGRCCAGRVLVAPPEWPPAPGRRTPNRRRCGTCRWCGRPRSGRGSPRRSSPSVGRCATCHTGHRASARLPVSPVFRNRSSDSRRQFACGEGT